MTLACGDAPVATDIGEAVFVVDDRSKQKPRCRCWYKTNAMLLMQEFSNFQHGVVKVLTLVCQSCYESFATVGEIRVYWRADFQSGSRVLKKVF